MIKFGIVKKDGSISSKQNYGDLNTRVFITSVNEIGYGSNISFENFKKLLQFVYIKYFYHFGYKQEYKNLDDWLDEEFNKKKGNLDDIFWNESYDAYELKKGLITNKINEIQSKTVTSDMYDEHLSYYYIVHCFYFKKEKSISDLRNDRNNYKKGFLNSIFNSNELNQITKDKITVIENEQQELIDIVRSEEFTMMQFRHSEIKYGKEILNRIQDKINKLLKVEKANLLQHTKNVRIESKKKELEEKQNLLETQRKIKYEKKKKELEEIKNRLEVDEIQKRKVGAKLKPRIKHNGHCPYCEIEFTSEIIIHLDHIHPMKLGGLEREDNLVKVCSTCNLKKSDMTLREFIKKFKLNRDKVEHNLSVLKKKF